MIERTSKIRYHLVGSTNPTVFQSFDASDVFMLPRLFVHVALENSGVFESHYGGEDCVGDSRSVSMDSASWSSESASAG